MVYRESRSTGPNALPTAQWSTHGLVGVVFFCWAYEGAPTSQVRSKARILGARCTADLLSGSKMQNMALLQTFINSTRDRPSLAVFQSSAAQSTIPVLRQYISSSASSRVTPRYRILFSLLYLPSSLLENTAGTEVEVHDWLNNVPGYSAEHFNSGQQLLSTLDQGKYIMKTVKEDLKVSPSSELAYGPARCDCGLHRHLALGRRIPLRDVQVPS